MTEPAMDIPLDAPVYQGQFGSFTITAHDRQEVRIYRAGLLGAALAFAIGVGVVVSHGTGAEPSPALLTGVTGLYALFTVSLGISLWTIHIYMRSLHRLLQLFWGMGTLAAIAIAIQFPTPLALTVYQQPWTILGIGFTFAALTGIFFKEAFCFHRLETKILTPIVPGLLLGHCLGWLPLGVEQALLIVWAGLQLVFAGRKLVQAIPDDIGDKSVFVYLQQQRTIAIADE